MLGTRYRIRMGCAHGLSQPFLSVPRVASPHMDLDAYLVSLDHIRPRLDS
jgi:hypothetical protein